MCVEKDSHKLLRRRRRRRRRRRSGLSMWGHALLASELCGKMMMQRLR
jgi:hypothetical protein